ncbi:unnamed protein product [Spirodela intermedia]|uniref:C2H2-type domain-containing protein n=1 Tax=Spirodela intermedia TaxID=51605 RepID=A0A7I8JP77_SPIIN|nr:unnamed protein product [Spirodela intermedia]CAA6671910.1 unnamed protein product [Spirodela intermedia]
MVSCHRCGEKFGRWDAMEAHHLSKHAGTSSSPSSSSSPPPSSSSSSSSLFFFFFLFFSSSSSSSSWWVLLPPLVHASTTAVGCSDGAGGGGLVEENRGDNLQDELGEGGGGGGRHRRRRGGGMIERVLKVHNMQKTLARFEEHREMVKQRAAKLPKKHPRCLADGNELLRFHGATVACSLGAGGAASVCSAEGCSVCRIIRQGFSARGGTIGSSPPPPAGGPWRPSPPPAMAGARPLPPAGRKALVLCRVIAGRVHRPVEDLREPPPLAGFDSLAGKVGLHANIEELYLLNPRACSPASSSSAGLLLLSSSSRERERESCWNPPPPLPSSSSPAPAAVSPAFSVAPLDCSQ